jgi:hypothetical protein
MERPGQVGFGLAVAGLVAGKPSRMTDCRILPCVSPDTPRLESIEVRLTFPRFLGAVLLTLVFLVLGFFLVLASYDTWLLQEMVLRRRLVVPRLLTFAANPTEFVLRCLFLASLGLVFFLSGLIFLAALVQRFRVLRIRFSRKRSSPACRCGSICSLSRALCSGLPCCGYSQSPMTERPNRSLASWK